MTVVVLLFASYRHQIGVRQLALTLPDSATVRDAAKRLEADYPDLSLKGALCAVNERYVSPDTALQEGDTLALLPPVSGGAGDCLLVTDEALKLDELIRYVSAPAYGAVASFIGTVRSPNRGKVVHFVDYEGYRAMIITQLKIIAAELRTSFSLGQVAVAHRLGRLIPGEASIIIAISSVHRAEALQATQACLEQCKVRLPIWKYEVGETEADWVRGVGSAAETI
jgi:molybdopterin synthase catalytic subunit